MIIAVSCYATLQIISLTKNSKEMNKNYDKNPALGFFFETSRRN